MDAHVSPQQTSRKAHLYAAARNTSVLLGTPAKKVDHFLKSLCDVAYLRAQHCLSPICNYTYGNYRMARGSEAFRLCGKVGVRVWGAREGGPLRRGEPRR